MKARKEDQWRIQGMQYALKIAKEQGIEALEEEIKLRGYYGVPFSIPKSALDEFTNNVKKNMVSTFTIMVALVLHDKFGFGTKRLKRFIDYFNDRADIVVEDYCTWQDMIDVLEEEANLKLEIYHNDKDVKI